MLTLSRLPTFRGLLVCPLLFAAAWVFWAPIPSVQAAPFDVVAIPTLGGAVNFASAINNNRQITGNSRRATGTFLFAYYWDANSLANAPVDIGILPGSNNFSRGFAINDAGLVTGDSDNNTPRFFTFAGPGGPIAEVTNTIGGTAAFGRGINNAGVIVGSANNGITTRPMIWDSTNAMRALPSLDGLTTTIARANDISDVVSATNNAQLVGRQLVVGFSRADFSAVGGPASVQRPTLWVIDPATGNVVGSPIDLGSLPASFVSPQQTPNPDFPFNSGEAIAVNNRGQVVGNSVVGRTSGGTSFNHAFIWDPETAGMTDLGTLGRVESRANAINDDGWVVGTVANIIGSSERAFLWRPDVGMVDLNDLIDPASGWVLQSATGINNLGDIVGFGSFGGQTRGFLITAVPEPTTIGTVAVVASLALALGVRRGRQTFPRA